MTIFIYFRRLDRVTVRATDLLDIVVLVGCAQSSFAVFIQAQSISTSITWGLLICRAPVKVISGQSTGIQARQARPLYRLDVKCSGLTVISLTAAT